MAFERVLEDLLAGSTSPTPREAPPPSPRTVGAQPPRKAKKSRGPKGYIKELVEEGFFKKPKTIAEVKAELANRGHHIALTSLSGPLQSLCQERVLRRHKARPDRAKKVAYNYSEW